MCLWWGASPSLGWADPTEDFPRQISHLEQVIFRGQEQLSCWAPLGGSLGLLEVPGRADLQDAVVGIEALQTQHQVGQLQAQGPPHPGTFVCNSYCVNKTVLLKQMGSLSVQTQEIANTWRLHVLRQPGASVWFFYSNRSSTHENFDEVENQKLRCFSLF